MLMTISSAACADLHVMYHGDLFPVLQVFLASSLHSRCHCMFTRPWIGYLVYACIVVYQYPCINANIALDTLWDGLVD
jgi:hypothetical protein